MNSLTPEWQNFFVAELGALSALTGLVVVAISINLSRILSIPNLPSRAGEALVMLVVAIVVASVALVPGQPALALGIEVCGVGLIGLAAPVNNQLGFRPSVQGVTTAMRISRVAVGVAATVPFVVAGAALILNRDGALYWIAAGMIVSLVAGVWNAWILMVEILR